jgi:hypothetical protein
MSEQAYRSIGSIIGLALGVGLMMAVGFQEKILPGAVFGAGGCVLGGIVAEKFYAWNKNRD